MVTYIFWFVKYFIEVHSFSLYNNEESEEDKWKLKKIFKLRQFDTQSVENSQTVPSTSKQLKLGKYLVEELQSLGIENALLNEYGVVLWNYTFK